jgi:Leucine-rich repeat (LRR) protein
MGGLRRLRCSHNVLESAHVPWAAFGALPQLAHLLLDHNALTSIGAPLCRSASLRVLDVSHNQLADLPAELSALTALEELTLDGNRLRSLPDSMGAMFDQAGVFCGC